MMRMAPPVLQRSFAALLEKNELFSKWRTKIQTYWQDNKKKFQFSDLRILTAVMMVRMVHAVLLRSFASFWIFLF